jgi:hypothetical protein
MHQWPLHYVGGFRSIDNPIKTYSEVHKLFRPWLLIYLKNVGLRSSGFRPTTVDAVVENLPFSAISHDCSFVATQVRSWVGPFREHSRSYPPVVVVKERWAAVWPAAGTVVLRWDFIAHTPGSLCCRSAPYF